jgi:hypothetical protein
MSHPQPFSTPFHRSEITGKVCVDSDNRNINAFGQELRPLLEAGISWLLKLFPYSEVALYFANVKKLI